MLKTVEDNGNVKIFTRKNPNNGRTFFYTVKDEEGKIFEVDRHWVLEHINDIVNVGLSGSSLYLKTTNRVKPKKEVKKVVKKEIYSIDTCVFENILYRLNTDLKLNGLSDFKIFVKKNSEIVVKEERDGTFDGKFDCCVTSCDFRIYLKKNMKESIILRCEVYGVERNINRKRSSFEANVLCLKIKMLYLNEKGEEIEIHPFIRRTISNYLEFLDNDICDKKSLKYEKQLLEISENHIYKGYFCLDTKYISTKSMKTIERILKSEIRQYLKEKLAYFIYLLEKPNFIRIENSFKLDLNIVEKVKEQISELENKGYILYLVEDSNLTEITRKGLENWMMHNLETPGVCIYKYYKSVEMYKDNKNKFFFVKLGDVEVIDLYC